MQCKLDTIAIADRAIADRAVQVGVGRLSIEMPPKNAKRKQSAKANGAQAPPPSSVLLRCNANLERSRSLTVLARIVPFRWVSTDFRASNFAQRCEEEKLGQGQRRTGPSPLERVASMQVDWLTG